MIEDDTEEGMLEIRKEEAAIEQQIEDEPMRLAQIRQEEDEIDRQGADLYRAIQYRKGY